MQMGTQREMLKVDGKLLKKMILERVNTLAYASKLIGMSADYLTNAINMGVVSRKCINALSEKMMINADSCIVDSRNEEDVDFNALAAELKNRGYTIYTASEKIGLSRNALSYCRYSGRISDDIRCRLRDVLQIDESKYINTPEARNIESLAAKPVGGVCGFDFDKLRNVIYEAAFNAFKDALNS